MRHHKSVITARPGHPHVLQRPESLDAWDTPSGACQTRRNHGNSTCPSSCWTRLDEEPNRSAPRSLSIASSFLASSLQQRGKGVRTCSVVNPCRPSLTRRVGAPTRRVSEGATESLASGWCTNPTRKRGPTGFSTEQVGSLFGGQLAQKAPASFFLPS
jgi:hypothetical protein